MVENFYSNVMGNFNGYNIVLVWITRSAFHAEYSGELGDTKKLSSKTDCKYLFELVQSILTKYTIDISKMVAQCYDGGANMCGGYKGVLARFKEICRRAFYLHCNDHILNFVVIDAAKSTTTSRNTFGIIAQLHNFIEGSSKRHTVFEAFQREGMRDFSHFL